MVEIPKSISLTTPDSGFATMLAGFRSLWITPASWTRPRICASSMARSRQSPIVMAPHQSRARSEVPPKSSRTSTWRSSISSSPSARTTPGSSNAVVISYSRANQARRSGGARRSLRTFRTTASPSGPPARTTHELLLSCSGADETVQRPTVCPLINIARTLPPSVGPGTPGPAIWDINGVHPGPGSPHIAAVSPALRTAAHPDTVRGEPPAARTGCAAAAASIAREAIQRFQ